MERTFEVFDRLESTTKGSRTEERVRRFMDSLDYWGISDDIPRPVFDGFYQLTDSADLEAAAGLPPGWRDEDIFHSLDAMAVSESVFLYKWLPKCSLKLRVDPYRTILRQMNLKDPHFNIVW